MAKLVASPGIDTRTWIALARVDDDVDAVRWAAEDSEDGPLGWLVDVTMQGGALDQDGPVTCRVAPYFEGRIDPITPGCLVLVVLSEGSANAQPTIVGVLNEPTCPPPQTVNGDTVNQQLVESTHVFVTPHAIDEEAQGDIRRTTTGNHRLHGQLVELAAASATQSYVRGEDLQAALDAFADQITINISSAVATILTTFNKGPAVPVTGTEVTAAQATYSANVTAFSTAVAQFKASVQAALSTRIKGE